MSLRKNFVLTAPGPEPILALETVVDVGRTRPGETDRRELTIRREVPTDGYVSCDTHIHTLTYSGHGDSTADERVLTLAGEGIELPIATEHNAQVDYHAAAVRLGVRRYFTPVVGNEVTTAVGHFNVFPVPSGGPVGSFPGLSL